MQWRIRNNQGQYLGRRRRLSSAGPRPWVDAAAEAAIVPTKGEAQDLAATLPAEAGAVLEPVTAGEEEGSE